jgi:tetratricopeptide (TPR) repeat protein
MRLSNALTWAAIALGTGAHLGGCAARKAAEQPVSVGAPTDVRPQAVQHDPNDPAWLTLDQIEPAPVLPQAKAGPATRPAPLEAIQLYARAHAALSGGNRQRQTAVNLLEKAVDLDPNSPELWEELGNAYAGSSQDKAISAWSKSLDLDPDNQALHEKLGRQYLIRNRLDAALKHLRLATQTTDYKQDNEAAAVTDFFLARTLQRKGYSRAALETYARLVQRIEHPTLAIRGNAELMGLLSQPELLYGEIGELYESAGDFGEAVRAYSLAAERAPDNFDYQSKLARALVKAGRGPDAQRLAEDMVSRFRANKDSLALLHETYRQLGREDRIIDVLQGLHEKNPKDRSLLFALADALGGAGRPADAERLLFDALRQNRGDGEVLKRLFDMYEKREDLEGATRLLVTALADDPDSLRQLTPLWGELLQPHRRSRLRMSFLQKLDVPPAAQGAKLFWVSRLADWWNRDALARSAIEQGAAVKPPFAPVIRLLVADYWERPDWDEKQKIEACAKAAADVRQQGNAALAAEIEGMSLLRQKGKSEQAAQKLAESIKLGNKSADVQLTQALAWLDGGKADKAEGLLWKLVSDVPSFEEAYAALFRYYLDQSQPAKAVNVLAKWLAADPGNVQARVLRSTLMFQAGRPDAAESELLSLFRDEPDNPVVLGAMYRYYNETRRLEEYIAKLEELRTKHPDNREAVEQLVMIYHEHKRLADALRVLDSAKEAAAGDPDLLYYLSHVYGRIDQKQTQEDMLQRVIELEPAHPGASNDLGYEWADEGKNMAKAEELIRVAVEAEPDNQSYLDSLGWVLYKRGKFGEALAYFERAIGPAARPDPVVLDHMGDVLYRLSRGADAIKQWQRAQERLKDMGGAAQSREDLKNLGLKLQQKLKQAGNAQPVDVAPIAVEASGKPVQAKN